MEQHVIHPLTKQALQQQLTAASHAVLLVGPAGIGKTSLAEQWIADKLALTVDNLGNYPYYRHVSADKTSSISISDIRGLEQFLSRKVPGNNQRIVLIQNAELLTTEAQNALLKTLEEPPAQTTILMTAPHARTVLPTIRSRATIINVLRPPAATVHDYYSKQGFSGSTLASAELMSGGLPGLLHALLHDEDHPLQQAVGTAREIVQKTSFERLAIVDALAKDKSLTSNVLALLQQMAQLSLRKTDNPASWQRILEQSYQAAELLEQHAQPKLVLTNFMLAL